MWVSKRKVLFLSDTQIQCKKFCCDIIWGESVSFKIIQYKVLHPIDKGEGLPDVAETGRAVCAVRGVRSAWSMVPGLPP